MTAVNPWRELEKELNARQREAVFCSDPHCLVLAGPGTGKTRTLVNRVVYLVSAVGAPPESILTLTFTRKAARVMVERLARYLGEEAGALRTGTFHHFCLELLRDQAGRGDIPRDFGVADEPRQIRTLERAWNRLGFSARQAEDRELRMLLGRFGAWRAQKDAALLSGLQQELFEEYRRLLRDERAIDFDDILHLARDLLSEDETLLAETRRRWPHVLVDEFQDTDALQYELLRLLSPVEIDVGGGAGSFLVADDQQSIYAWRGADRRNVENYRRDYSPRVICLEENYRNREAILAGARTVLAGGSETEADRPIVSRAAGPGSLRLETFPSEQEEAAFLAADIRSARARQRDLRWGQIAILYPKHSIGEFLETRLMGERVPVELVSGRALLDQPRIRRVVAALRILRNGSDDEALGTLLAARLDEGSYALLRRVARGRGDSLRAALDLLLRGSDRLRGLRRAWERFRESGESLEDVAWLAAWDERFPAGMGLDRFLPDMDEDDAAPTAPSDRRRRILNEGETLSRLARLPWVLGGVVARLGNLRTGQSGRGLGQLVREILMEFEDVEEGAPALPGDPADHAGLAEILGSLGRALRKGRRVLLSHPSAPETAPLLAAMLREGREPWHAQCIAAEEGVGAGTALKLRVEPSRLILADGKAAELVATGAPGSLLVFRLAQLWRAADHRPLQDYIVFDFETTGSDPSRCELVEIAAIRYEGRQEVGRFETLVRPAGPIPPGATSVHGITDAMVADAALPGPALQDFLNFLGNRDLVAHNGAGFDFPILRRLARAHGLSRPDNALFDTLALARRLFPGERASLAALIDRFGIKAEARHRALDDCRCLAEAFARMQELHLTAMRRRCGRESLAPMALALHIDGSAADLEARDPEAFALFNEGVRRLLASGNDWLDRHLEDHEEPGASRRVLESELLEAAGLSLEAPDLFTGLRSEEERFLSLVPRFDELYLGDSLAGFLDFLALYQAADFAAGTDAVQMMTIHAAKGLEFEHVYIVGLEEKVLPGFYALRSGDPAELDEERRLLYVGMTRAGAALTLTRVESRGGFQQEPSRFLAGLAEGGEGS